MAPIADKVVAMPSRQLLAYRFGSESKFEGQLVGALERVESGGAMRVLDALFVAREPESGELTAVSLSGGRSGGIIGQLLEFRLDAGARNAATQRALQGEAGEAVRELADVLEPGNAIAAVLVEHAWAGALGDAVARVGGTEVVSEFLDATRVSEITHRLRAAAEPSGTSG
jgi:hypothetical protein